MVSSLCCGGLIGDVMLCMCAGRDEITGNSERIPGARCSRATFSLVVVVMRDWPFVWMVASGGWRRGIPALPLLCAAQSQIWDRTPHADHLRAHHARYDLVPMHAIALPLPVRVSAAGAARRPSSPRIGRPRFLRTHEMARRPKAERAAAPHAAASSRTESATTASGLTGPGWRPACACGRAGGSA
jgi:hypothetical protein